MTRILHIDSSPTEPRLSASRRLSAAVVKRLRGLHPGAQVTVRDLAAEPPPHIDEAIRSGWSVTADQRTPEQVAIVTRSEGLIAELRAADLIVIGAPMHNFSVPSVLKAWIDHVLIAGQTFRYTPEGRPEGLVEGRRVYLALSRGGIYSEGPLAAIDYQEPLLRTALGFIGITALEVVRAEGMAMGPDAAASGLACGLAAVDALAAAGSVAA